MLSEQQHVLHLFQITAVGTFSAKMQSEPFKAWDGMSDLLTEQMGGGGGGGGMRQKSSEKESPGGKNRAFAD